MRSESWLRLMSGLVLVGIFAAGALFGAGLMKWTSPAPQQLPAPPLHGGPMMAMRDRLALVDAQVVQLQAIMRAHQAELDAIAHQTQDRVRDVLMNIEEELAPQLTAEQLRLLEEWRKHRGPPPGPPGMGPPGMGPPGMRPPH